MNLKKKENNFQVFHLVNKLVGERSPQDRKHRELTGSKNLHIISGNGQEKFKENNEFICIESSLKKK